MLSDEKILVTGPAGQIAFPLAESLARDNEVWGIARFGNPATRDEVEAAGVTTRTGDLGGGDFGDLPDDFTYVLHLAALMAPDEDYDEAIRVNAEGTGLLLAHCRKAKAALVMSTQSTYRPHEDPAHVFLETDPLGDAHSLHSPPYSISKIAQEAVARYCARALDLPVDHRPHELLLQRARRPAHAAPHRGHGRQPRHHPLGPLLLQPDPPGRHQRAGRGAARRGQRPGDDRQLGGRRARDGAGVGRVLRRARGRHARR